MRLSLISFRAGTRVGWRVAGCCRAPWPVALVERLRCADVRSGSRPVIRRCRLNVRFARKRTRLGRFM